MKPALTRYRVLAYATGVFLLLLTAHVILQFARPEVGVSWWERDGVGAFLPGGGTWIPMAHGYLYLAYVIFTADLWFRTRLPVGRTILVVLAGTVPLMSFVAERWVTGRIQPIVDAEAASQAPRAA